MTKTAYRPGLGSNEARAVTLYATLQTGAAGVIVAATTVGKGFSTFTRNSAGKYTIVMNSALRKLVKAHFTLIGSAAVPPNGKATEFELISETLNTNGTFILQCLFPNGTGFTAADIEDNARILIALDVLD